MNGWVSLGLLAVLSLGVLLAIGRFKGGLWQVAAAAILLGMTGYALQGRPAVPASLAKIARCHGRCRRAARRDAR